MKMELNMKMKALIAASFLMIGTPVLAQDRGAGLSDAAKQTLQKNLTERDAELAPLVAKRRELQQQFDALLTPQGYDEDKLAATMAAMRSVEGEIVEKTGTSMLALIKALPEDDRAAFFKTLKRPGPATRAATQGETGR